MVHSKPGCGKKDEPPAAPGWVAALLYAPLFAAALVVLALIATLHLMYRPWLDARHRQYTLYLSSAVALAAFLACCCIAFFFRRKQMYVRRGYVTVHTRLLDGMTYLPFYVDVEAPPAKTSALPVKFVPPPDNTAKPAAG